MNGINHSLAALRGYALLRDDRFKEERRKAWIEDITPSVEKLNQLSAYWTNSENLTRLMDIRNKLAEFEKYQEEIEAIVGTPENRPDLQFADEKVDPLGLKMLEQVTALIDLEKLRSASDENKKLLSHMADFRGSLSTMRASLLAYLLSKEARHKQAFVIQREKNSVSITAIEKLSPIMTLEQRRHYRALQQSYSEFLPLPQKLFQRRDRDDYNIGIHTLDTKAVPIAFELKTVVEDMAKNQQVLMHEDFLALAAALERMTWIEYTLLIVGILVASLLSMLLIRSFVNSVETARDSADAIAEGDLTTEVQVNGAKELRELGGRLETMRQSLLMNHEKQHALLAVREAQGKLAFILQTSEDIMSLSNDAITFLCEFSDSKVGALYALTEDNSDELHLTGTYAFTRRKCLTTKIAVGDGLVSQAALEKKSILISNVSTDYIKISSGLGESEPRHVLVVPILRRELVMGVIEMGSFETYSDALIETIESMASSIGIALEIAQEKDRTKKLLETTLHQSDALQRQQEEMAAQNEELQEQTAALKSSEEQLLTQSKELQASNQELREQSNTLAQQKLEIEQNSQRVEQAKQELERQARELEQANKYKSEFLANMSHELRTPLNSLLILADSLVKNKSGNLTPAQVEKAQVIHSGGQDLLVLINDILDLSKVEAGKLDLHMERLSLEGILNQLRRQFKPIAEDKGLALNVTVEAEAPETIRTDGQRIQQILRNLLSNSCKFTEQGSVSIRIHRPKSMVRFNNIDVSLEEVLAFSVIDTGIGIPKDKQEHIWGAFQQADGSTSRRFGGTGLGLSISYELAKLLGGEIHLESLEGHGSTFTLYLPINGCEDSADTEEQTHRASVTSQHDMMNALISDSEDDSDVPFLPDDRENVTDHHPTVLIIEDDAAFAKILMDISHKQGFLCLAAGDGRSGFKMATRYRPSAIILDVGLPQIDGLTVLDGLKSHDDTSHIPVHVVSAFDEQISALQKGALGYLKKPINSEALDRMFQLLESVLQSKVMRLLVVEDHVAGREAMNTLLERPDVQITFASSGKEAYEKLVMQSFDCVVLDLGLPDMSGLGLLEKVKDESSVNLPPVIIYTGQELTKDEYVELSQYAESVVIKGPSSPDRLLDELSIFFHCVDSQPPVGQRRTGPSIDDVDQTLKGKKDSCR